MKFKATLVKIWHDGSAKVYNFNDLKVADESFDDALENTDLRHVFLIDNETGDVIGSESDEDS